MITLTTSRLWQLNTVAAITSPFVVDFSDIGPVDNLIEQGAEEVEPATTNMDPSRGTSVFVNDDEDLTCMNCDRKIPVGAKYVADFVTVCTRCDRLFAQQDIALTRANQS